MSLGLIFFIIVKLDSIGRRRRSNIKNTLTMSQVIEEVTDSIYSNGDDQTEDITQGLTACLFLVSGLHFALIIHVFIYV